MFTLGLIHFYFTSSLKLLSEGKTVWGYIIHLQIDIPDVGNWGKMVFCLFVS